MSNPKPTACWMIDMDGVLVHEGRMVPGADAFLDTDIVAGLEAGMRTVLALTGITQAADVERFPFRPHRVVASIADLVEDL